MAVAATKTVFLVRHAGGHHLARPFLLLTECSRACRLLGGIIKGGSRAGAGSHRGVGMTISTCGPLSLGVPQPQHHQSDIKTNRWNRAIAEADKLLGYPKMITSGTMFSATDFLSMATQLDSIVEPNHPLLKIIETTQARSRFVQFTNMNEKKRMVYGHNNIQARGLIILTLSKVIGHLEIPTKASKEEVYHKHHVLATGVDLGHTSTIAHSAISNVDVNCDRITLDRIDYANKVSIMIGDMMMARANLLIGSIRSVEVARIMANSVADFVEGKFMYDQDDQGNAYPTKDITMTDWKTKSFKVHASMMANSCRALMILGEMDERYRTLGFEFGKHLGLAWQASADLEQFTDCDENSTKAPFSLVSCPVVLHLQRDKSLLNLVAPHHKDLSKVDYKKVYEIVSDGPAIREAQELCQSRVQKALNTLQQLPNSEARSTLENIVTSLEV